MIDTIKDINMGTTNSAPVPTENMCECHKINWMSVLDKGEPEMIDGSLLLEGLSCEDKVELCHMDTDEYDTICKYIPGDKCSNFPQEVIQYLCTNNEPEVIDNDKKNAEMNNKMKKVDTIAWWQEPGDTPVRWEQQTLDPVLVGFTLKCMVKSR